jgi:hypothetical protein
LHRDRCATTLSRSHLPGQLNCYLQKLYRDTQLTHKSSARTAKTRAIPVLPPGLFRG